jgi:pre-mRNA cleavage complex 2 protein Pcf11
MKPNIRALCLKGIAHSFFLLCNRSVDLLTKFLYLVNDQVPPWMKLPAFYLLDAISKNVYEPYARVFASFVIPLFLDTYRAVDDGTRSKMDEMLLTWRTGAPNGKELFGLGPQMAIERGIWGDQAVSTIWTVYPPIFADVFQGPGQITKTQVMSELNFALQAKERAIATNPNDLVSKHHIQVLVQVCTLIFTSSTHV